MSFNDLITRYTTALSVNAPYLALDEARAFLQINAAVLAEYDLLWTYAQGLATQLSYKTTTGQPLIARGSDFGVPYNAGSFSQGTGTFILPTPAPTSYLIPAGTQVATDGDDIVTPLSIYQTQADTTLAAGATASAPVGIIATRVGAGYNQGIGAITQVITNLGAGVGFTNTTATTGGTDQDSNPEYQDRIAAQVNALFSPAKIEAAILAVSGVYDAYVDPTPVITTGGGGTSYTFNYYWCAVDGSQPSDLAGVNGPVALAVAAKLPPGLAGVSNAFTVISYDAGASDVIHATYSAPASVLSATIEAQIQTAIQEYFQGDGTNPRSGMIHGLVPDSYSIGIAVQQGYNPLTNTPVASGGLQTLTAFTVTSFTPSPGSASATKIVRLTGPINNGSGSTVLLVRI